MPPEPSFNHVLVSFYLFFLAALNTPSFSSVGGGGCRWGWRKEGVFGYVGLHSVSV